MKEVLQPGTGTVEYGPLQLEAFAICREVRSGKWWCDGPGQELSTADYPTVQKALDMVDCWPAESAAGARTKGGHSANLYRCGYGLRSFERNIPKIHNIAAAPRTYRCAKNFGGRCKQFYGQSVHSN